MAHDFTEEELEGLSEAEREAILSAEEEATAQVGDTTPDPDLEDDDDDEQAAAGADDAPPAVDDEAAAATAAETPPADDSTATDEEPAEFTPRHVVEPPADAAEKFAEFARQKEELRTKLNDGDIGIDEFTAELDAIGKEERALEREVWEAESAQKRNEHEAKQRWEWEQEQFFKAEQNAVYKDKYILGALNQAVIDLANDSKNEGKPGPWYLAEADKIIRERFNLTPAKPNDPPKDKPTPPARARVQVPPTLASMPAAELSETGGADEFAHLDKLTGFDLEAALAKMTPEQQDRYLGVHG